MNERIKKLVAQAEDYASEHEEHWHDGPDWQELFNEKFAELIIKECATLAYDGPSGILDHFGVEE